MKLNRIFELMDQTGDAYSMSFDYLCDHGNKTIEIKIIHDDTNEKDALNLLWSALKPYQSLRFFNSILIQFEI